MKSGHVSPATLARIAGALKKHGIRHKDVAEEATKTSPRGHVSESMVTRVLGGHSKSANVVVTARRMIAEAKAPCAERIEKAS